MKLKSNESAFTLYWKDGRREIIVGEDIADAFHKAGYGSGALGALDWYDQLPSDTHRWDADSKDWVKRTPNRFSDINSPEKISSAMIQSYLEEYHRVELEMPSKDLLCVDLEYSRYPDGWARHIRVYTAHYHEGPYCDDGSEETHHYMVGGTHYFHPQDIDKACELVHKMLLAWTARLKDHLDLAARNHWDALFTQDHGQVDIKEICDNQPVLL
ncbi:hypothetical protein LUCX_100 [Xanthomonas phage vB_XciM_LucasX]|nr:hypothetical protein LUCX_100 [Xanthomonas phage vB_XciM_LucasX]